MFPIMSNLALNHLGLILFNEIANYNFLVCI